MFDVSFGEIFFIIVIALAVLGPEGLPEAARKLGELVATIKHYLQDIARDVSEHDEAREVMKEVHGTVREIRNAVNLRGIVREIEDTIDDSVTEVSESIREVKDSLNLKKPSDPYFEGRGVRTGRHFRVVRPGRRPESSGSSATQQHKTAGKTQEVSQPRGHHISESPDTGDTD